MMPVVWGAGGFIGTAMVQGFVDTLVPTTFTTGASSSTMTAIKYMEIAVAIVITTWAAKKFLGPGAAAFVGVGGGIFALQQAVHDFLPGTIPGMHAYTPLKAYTPVRRSSTMGAIIESAGGQMPQLATYAGMPQLAGIRGMRGGMRSPDQGFKDTATYAADGAMNVVAERFRRF